MEYLIITFLIFIILTVAVIAYYFKQYSSFRPTYRFASVQTIERYYGEVVKLQNSFSYIGEDRLRNSNFYDIKDHKIIRDDKHKERIIHDYTFQLASEMIKQGLVEINEMDDYPMSDVKRVWMEARVYKPEH